MTFQEGDRVRWTGDSDISIKGIVKKTRSGQFPYFILWSDPSSSTSNWYSPKYLVLIEEKKIIDVDDLFKEIEEKGI